MDHLATFNSFQIDTINHSVLMAEELVSDSYKLSSGQWFRKRYDIKTLSDLAPDEIVHGPFAQILHYEARPKNSHLESTTFDFYKICLQDHAILAVIDRFSEIKLFPFSLYIIIHELIHIVRFVTFLQNFHASSGEKMDEERRVHRKTREILKDINIGGMKEVLDFYRQWIIPIDDMITP
ncbi:MAG: hypothetical protein R6U50_10615 [Desulfobacterales bacterium]